MKKILTVGLLIMGLVMVNPMLASAGGSCKKCASKCKISKLKKKVKCLLSNKDELKVTDDQVQQVMDIKHDAMKKLIQSKADTAIIKVDVKTEMFKESIDVDSVNALIDAKYASKVTTAKIFVKAVSDIKSVLSSEQRAQWLDIAKAKMLKGSKCGSCASKVGGKFCPLTGKPLSGKSSPKGSMTE